MRALWRGSEWKMPIFCPRSQFLAGSSYAFSQKVHGTDHLLCAFWTAGFTARAPDIGSVRCTQIFQVSDPTIVCIFFKAVCQVVPSSIDSKTPPN